MIEEIYTITVGGVHNHKKLQAVLSNYVEGYTASYGDGYDKNYGFEQVAVVKIFAVSDRTVRALVQALLREFNQKEITVEDVEGRVEFHKRDSITHGLPEPDPIPDPIPAPEGVYPTKREARRMALRSLRGLNRLS